MRPGTAVAHLDEELARPSDRRDTRSTTGAPSPVTRSAFSIRLSMIWRTRTGSVRTGCGVRTTSSTNRTPDAGGAVGPHRRRVRAQDREVEVHGLDGDVDGPEPGEVEQVGHEPVEVVGLGADHPGHGRDVLGRHDAVGQGLGVALDGGQRRAQLVGDGQEELALPALALVERRRQPVERDGDVGHLAGALRDRSGRRAGPELIALAAAAACTSGRVSRRATQ